MMSPTTETILLTGASGGIGEALAREVAGPGRCLILLARDRARLERLAAELKARGAETEIHPVDLRETDRLAEVLSDISARHVLDVVIVNAGVTAGLGADRSVEALADQDRQLDVNLRGAMHTVSALVEPMRRARRGRIALVASLAGMRPLPDMPAYSASKAGLIAYGHALRGWLKPFGVSVTILCPGFVTSPMSARHKGAKPFEIPADVAARRMWRAIRARRAFYAFPFLLAWGIRLQNLLPPWAGDLFMGGFAATVEPDPRYRDEEPR
ncbi:SDR family NAD(P)-dependent oxidoreductase [Roseibium aestuarii]